MEVIHKLNSSRWLHQESCQTLKTVAADTDVTHSAIVSLGEQRLALDEELNSITCVPFVNSFILQYRWLLKFELTKRKPP